MSNRAFVVVVGFVLLGAMFLFAAGSDPDWANCSMRLGTCKEDPTMSLLGKLSGVLGILTLIYATFVMKPRSKD